MNPRTTRILRPVIALGIALGLSACASVDRVDSNAYYDAASRAAPIQSALNAPAETGAETQAETRAEQAAPHVLPNFKVVAVNVNVPRELTVSEANRYLPRGDIVWREDPMGDRHQQVQTIVANALTQGVAQFQGEREVVLDVIVSRFHALTEKARYTVGGVHAIQFTLQIRDAATGEVLIEPHFIKADFDALGGQAAVQAEARGMTQKVRITDHLAYVIQQELSRPEGFVAYNTGLIGAINQL